jgi:hypothetical protein
MQLLDAVNIKQCIVSAMHRFHQKALLTNSTEQVAEAVKEATPNNASEAKGQANEAMGQAKGKAAELQGEASKKAGQVEGEINKKM